MVIHFWGARQVPARVAILSRALPDLPAASSSSASKTDAALDLGQPLVALS